MQKPPLLSLVMQRIGGFVVLFFSVPFVHIHASIYWLPGSIVN